MVAFLAYMPVTVTEILKLVALLVVLRVLGLVIYRLLLSPLSKFPGPRLAAATYWYEFYWDVWLRGQYTFHIIELHKKYGPIIRINPFEVHIADPAFIDEVYTGTSRKRDRSEWFTRQFGPSPCILSTQSHDLHRLRRSVLSPFFSKTNVRKLSHVIENKTEQLMDRLSEAKEAGAVLHMNAVYAAVANDVVTQYTFGMNHNRIAHPHFDPDFHDIMEPGLQSSNLMKQMPWIQNIVHRIPISLMLKLQPSYGTYLEMRKSVEDETANIKNAFDDPTHIVEAGHQTIFQGVLESKLPVQEKTLARMTADAGTVMVASTLTTAWTLSLATYYLLSHPVVLRRLKEEIITAMPQGKTVTPADVENLPYLTAVVQECYRLSYGSSSRLQRPAPDEVLVYNDGTRAWTIPKGTPIGMTAVQIHHDEAIWGRDSHTFRPERFLEHPRLDKYLLHFSRGSRLCIGQNLANAEIYHILARVWRVYGSKGVSMEEDEGVLELYETQERDVKCSAHLNFPAVWKGSKGVRVRVSRR